MILVVIAGIAIYFGVGSRTSFGAGIDPRLGAQVARDFLADQDAEAAALSKADQSPLSGHLGDSALADVIQQIHDQPAPAPAVSFQPTSITVLRAQDPNDVTLVVEVKEDGTKSVISPGGSNSAPSQQSLSFHGDFWLRLAAGHYLISDQSIQIQPVSYLPDIALAVAGLLWVGIAAVLLRRRQPAGNVPAEPTAPDGPTPPIESVPATVGDEEEPTPASIEIRTFGGLHVLHAGADAAPALISRTVMAFVWRRMLLAAVLDRRAAVIRDELSRQVYPRQDRETQLKRMRNLVSQGLRELPEPLRSRIVVEPQVLHFQLSDCRVDAIDLLDLSAECETRATLSPSQTMRAQRLVEVSAAPFLPEFETVEDVATDHHPSCTDLVVGLRAQLAAKHVELAVKLADTYTANRQNNRAIAILEPLHKDHPTRTDVADGLAAAYRAAGRERDARGLAGRGL